MKKTISVFCFLFTTIIILGQTPSQKYFALIKKADTFYRLKNYKTSALTYSTAFKMNHRKASADEHFNAACSWALAGIPDSAFSQLNFAIASGYENANQLTTDHDLVTLHKDKRWKLVLESVKKNEEERLALLNKPLIKQLDSINKDDQNDRARINDIESNYGGNSKEMNALWKTISKKDSLNLVKVKYILDTYGWLGPDVITDEGSTTLFLVIQHADQKTQEHYLPIMREAVKRGKARASALALLEDRVALGQGKKQIYGSQIIKDPKTGKDTLAPIEDFANVDKRRDAVGLGSLEEYANHWGIVYKPKAKANRYPPVFSNCNFATAIEIHDSIIGPLNVCRGNFAKPKIDTFNAYGYRELNNDAWFKFTITHDTIITFDIVPNEIHNDYDFFLFKCQSADCMDKIRSCELKADRFCYSVNYDHYGATGLSGYTAVNYLGSGNASTGYVAALPVKAGETYYLMVGFAADQSSSKGFTIYFYNYWPKKPKGLKSKKPIVKSLQARSAIVLENVLFESDKTILLKQSSASLDKLVNQLQVNKTMKIEVRGHTDNTGDELKNQQLSEGRAKAIVDYLVLKGIDKSRIPYKGFGSKQPIASNDSEEGKQKNRRVEFVVITR